MNFIEIVIIAQKMAWLFWQHLQMHFPKKTSQFENKYKCCLESKDKSPLVWAVAQTGQKPQTEKMLWWICTSSDHHALTIWGRDKMAAILRTTFSNAFSWMKMYELHLRFRWSLFLSIQLTIFQHWFRWWLGTCQATCHYLNQWWFSLLMHICVTGPQWVNHSAYIKFVISF